ncbi:Acetylornithine deacetylase/Succinyl-diaminopimelate desuccinylase [Raineyella antarctica]|uniref:Acetylornithine deacetylase/Succinyl-diaminopimelate desuccinylase n=1 Tax=Raineyella antarctica TaxID=1577474 RepID=A0A1G6GFB1_9ACTN|nr:dipeptidase [Raineyella antarctica]SDB79836.1 Acetylornithine deacetylase/Succinyl-diaminopimelate desuccinylase [Raineyella antarctica]
MAPDDLAARIDQLLPEVLADLTRLVAIRSISSDPERAGDVAASAEAVAALLTDAGCPDVRIVAAGGAPAVIGRYPAPEGTPTVCLYAHHDVQPTGDPAGWASEPFTVTRRGERLYGRGVVDDKAGIAVHLAALRAFDGRPPVGVTLFIEGEEEVGSPTLGALLEQHADELAADLYVIADSGNWDVGVPAFTTTLRGLADCTVTVRTLDHALHSGQFGGVAPDALTALCRLVATLHDERGNVAIEGLVSRPGPDLEYPADRLAAESGVLPGVDYLGDGPVTERLWTRPAVSVIGIDATPVDRASNTLAPSARAKISLRLAPGQDPRAALDALVAHLESHTPWNARVEVVRGETGAPGEAPLEGPYGEAALTAFAAAWGRRPVTVGQGGSIPMVADFQQRFPAATVLVTAVSDPDSRMHGLDESLHLDDFRRACLAEALLLEQIVTAMS